MSSFCAIDFGTSNSAIALPRSDGEDAGVHLVELEAGQRNMPTAVFYSVEGLAPHEDAKAHYGRAAVAAYVEGIEGRLMRSMKSILGSTLADQATEVGAGRSVRYLDVVSSYLRRLKTLAEREAGQTLTRVVLGRPVFFVDDDAQRDSRAQTLLAEAARQVGFSDVHFQYEPIAAALDYETTVSDEQMVLVADIGGGTSDFSLVRVGPQRRMRLDRRPDILANHGVHIAGTDFDRRIALAHIMPACGFGGRGPSGREVPSKVYFDLATWHLINTVYAPARVAELRLMKGFYSDLQHHRRLMTVVNDQLGHELIGRAEIAKIAVAEGGSAVPHSAELARLATLDRVTGSRVAADLSLNGASAGGTNVGGTDVGGKSARGTIAGDSNAGARSAIDLSMIEADLGAMLDEKSAVGALDADLQRIVNAADETLLQAGLAHERVDALYFTGGSTGFTPLAERIAARFPSAVVRRGDRFASVVQGLGVHARQLFGD